MTKEELQDILSKIPDGTELDLTNIMIKAKECHNKMVRKWDDLEYIKGFWVDMDSKIYNFFKNVNDTNRNNHIGVFATEAQAKSALAFAQISQIMPYYCKPFNRSELYDRLVPKYKIIVGVWGEGICKLMVEEVDVSNPVLVFRTEDQAENFLLNNKELIKQYYMI